MIERMDLMPFGCCLQVIFSLFTVRFRPGKEGTPRLRYDLRTKRKPYTVNKVTSVRESSK